MPNSAPHRCLALASKDSNTGASSPDELEMTRSTSEVAVCCSKASFNSRRLSANVRFRLSFLAPRRSVTVGSLQRLADRALLRVGFVAFPCRAFASLRFIVPRRLTWLSLGDNLRLAQQQARCAAQQISARMVRLGSFSTQSAGLARGPLPLRPEIGLVRLKHYSGGSLKHYSGAACGIEGGRIAAGPRSLKRYSL